MATHNTPGLKLNYDVVVLVRDFLQHALRYEEVKKTAPDERIAMVVDGMSQYIQQALSGPQNDLAAQPAAGQVEANQTGVAVVVPPPPPHLPAQPLEDKKQS